MLVGLEKCLKLINANDELISNTNDILNSYYDRIQELFDSIQMSRFFQYRLPHSNILLSLIVS